MRTKNALQYTIDTILTIALGYRIDFSVHEYSRDCIKILINEHIISFNICSSDAFDALLQGNLDLTYINAFDDTYQIPALQIHEKDRFYDRFDNELIINFDILSLPFILLSNLDEYISEKKGEFERFDYKHSISKKYNIVRIPLVDEYAFLLRKMLIDNTKISIRPRKSQIIPTHDIDDIYRFTSFSKSIKSILSQFYRTRNIKETFLALRFFIKSFSDKKKDPYFKGIERLLEDSDRLHLKSVFFFMAAEKSLFDSGYDIHDKNLKEIFNKIDKSGMLLGLHPGFYTFRDKNLLQKQIKNLESSTNTSIVLSRQHYLRFDRKETFDNLQDSGIETDYTMGFAEEEGFKCGTAHEFHPYNFEKDEPYKIKEKPLITMDVTLTGYKKYSLLEAEKSLKELHTRIKRTEGDFVILWHNAYVYREVGFYENVYLEFLKKNMN
jgi:hypothetical protein